MHIYIGSQLREVLLTQKVPENTLTATLFGRQEGYGKHVLVGGRGSR